MKQQITDTILMVEPIHFGYNSETAVNNYFQSNDHTTPDLIQKSALSEFRGMVDVLTNHGISVLVVRDNDDAYTPDSLFPNNWISFHGQDGVVVYPMYAENRRAERRSDIIDILQNFGYSVAKLTDYSSFEQTRQFLEGTGSLVLDRVNRIAYAALSERTCKRMVERFCADFGFKAVMFTALQTVGGLRMPVYHTNVMLSVGDKIAIACLSCIDNVEERKQLIDCLEKTDKLVVEISEDQMHCFAGNMLELRNTQGEHKLVMSQSAFHSLSANQKEQFGRFCEFVVVRIPTIEKYGGGSVRCMIAEIF